MVVSVLERLAKGFVNNHRSLIECVSMREQILPPGLGAFEVGIAIRLGDMPPPSGAGMH